MKSFEVPVTRLKTKAKKALKHLLALFKVVLKTQAQLMRSVTALLATKGATCALGKAGLEVSEPRGLICATPAHHDSHSCCQILSAAPFL